MNGKRKRKTMDKKKQQICIVSGCDTYWRACKFLLGSIAIAHLWDCMRVRCPFKRPFNSIKFVFFFMCFFLLRLWFLYAHANTHTHTHIHIYFSVVLVCDTIRGGHLIGHLVRRHFINDRNSVDLSELIAITHQRCEVTATINCEQIQTHTRNLGFAQSHFN